MPDDWGIETPSERDNRRVREAEEVRANLKALEPVKKTPRDTEPQHPAIQHPCRCPDYTKTMHGGARYCPFFDSFSAFCVDCGGCKACSVYNEFGSYMRGAQGQTLWVSEDTHDG